MYSILIHCEPHELDTLTANLWEAGTTGITEEPGGFRAFFEDSTPVELVAEQIGRTPVSVRQERIFDWGQASLDSFEPVLAGERFFLVPHWRSDPTPPGRIRIEINPGMACGTGYHQCTQMCLEAMERYLKPGDSFLDVGTGTGILSKAALLLGASVVVGCDIDEDAVIIARELAGDRFFLGSAPAVAARRFDVVAANISGAVVETLAPDLKRVVKPEGTLILSGFPDSEDVQGFDIRERLQKDDWLCLIA